MKLPVPPNSQIMKSGTTISERGGGVGRGQKRRRDPPGGEKQALPAPTNGLCRFLRGGWRGQQAVVLEAGLELDLYVDIAHDMAPSACR